ncbi:MAG: hypothetical protein KIT02_14520 [Devosia sp.]|uniref:DUF6339 family protein n=1 Tax=Devosia sp. TaxID=1871048 RepID=UPI0024CD6775|nr:DUF6339 family protein [Devosia sp.]UYN99126.1 MAG: hypothetical protein KIT02_14520 [Devosia sp.]
MKTRFLRSAALEDLRAQVSINLPLYRTGAFDALSLDASLWFEHTTEVDEQRLQEIRLPNGPDMYETDNCLVIYDAFAKLSPYEARDERLWTYYSHTHLLEYARMRWPLPADDAVAVGHVLRHFFARDKRQLERDNAISRLWWMAHLCVRVPELSREEALAAFLFKTDVRANLIERPTTSQSTELFGAVLRKLISSYQGEKRLFERRTFRRLMSEINSVGGFKLIDCMDADQSDALVSELVRDKLSLETI